MSILSLKILLMLFVCTGQIIIQKSYISVNKDTLLLARMAINLQFEG